MPVPVETSIKKRIDDLCEQAWRVALIDIKEVNLSDKDAKQLDIEIQGSYYYGEHTRALLNPVTGSMIKINRHVAADPFEDWCPREYGTARVQFPLYSEWYTSPLSLKDFLRHAYNASREQG